MPRPPRVRSRRPMRWRPVPRLRADALRRHCRRSRTSRTPRAPSGPSMARGVARVRASRGRLPPASPFLEPTHDRAGAPHDPVREDALRGRQSLGVEPDEDLLLVLLDSGDDRVGRGFGARPRDAVEERGVGRTHPLGISHDVRPDAAGVYAGDANGFTGKLLHERFGEGENGVLRDVVGPVFHEGDHRVDARDVDDVTFATLPEQRQEGFGPVDDAPHVDVDHELEVLVRDLFEAGPHREPGIVDDDVDAAVLSGDIRRVAFDGLSTPDVDDMNRRLCAFGTEHAGGFVKADLIHVRKRDAGALRREPERKRAPDARRRSRYGHHLVFDCGHLDCARPKGYALPVGRCSYRFFSSSGSARSKLASRRRWRSRARSEWACTTARSTAFTISRALYASTTRPTSTPSTRPSWRASAASRPNRSIW